MTHHLLCHDEGLCAFLSKLNQHCEALSVEPRLFSNTMLAEILFRCSRVYHVSDSRVFSELPGRLRRYGFCFVDSGYASQHLLHAKFEGPYALWLDSREPWDDSTHNFLVDFTAEVFRDDEDIERDDLEEELIELDLRFLQAMSAFAQSLSIGKNGVG